MHWLNLNHGKEVNSIARQATGHQKGKRIPLRMSEEPKVFVAPDRELLVIQEAIPEKGEAKKLGDKTALKFDEKEGFTLIHKDQNYRITTVEKEKLGDLELRRYKTKQGEEFLHIPGENKVAPPYETPWYALPKTTTIHLDNEYQRELLKDATSEAGGVRALQHELEKVGARTHRDSLYDYWSGRVHGMYAEKLIPVLRYLDRDLDEPNKHIKAIGRGGAIENPRLTFRLDTTDGARLLSADSQTEHSPSPKAEDQDSPIETTTKNRETESQSH